MKLLMPEVLPEWFLLMNDNCLLTSKEIIKLFGFKNISCIKAGISFPLPDIKNGDRIKVNRMTSIYKKQLWRKTTILKEIERRKELNNNG